MSDFNARETVNQFYENCLYEFQTEFKKCLHENPDYREDLEEVYSDLSDRLFEYYDSPAFVIYTYQAAQVCVEYIDDEAAYDLFTDIGGCEGCEGLSDIFTRFAYAIAEMRASEALTDAYEEAQALLEQLIEQEEEQDQDQDEEEND